MTWVLLGDRQLWICMVWSCSLTWYVASQWKEKGKEKLLQSGASLLPPRDTEHPWAKAGNRFGHSKCSNYWMQHKQSQEHQLLLQLSLQEAYSTLFTMLSSWERERERGAFRHVLLLSLRGLVPSGSSGTQVCSEHSMWQSSWALEAVLEGICSSALFSPQRFLMVVLDAPTGKDVCHKFLLPCIAV